MTTRHPAILALLVAPLMACSFGDPGALVPDYSCQSDAQCSIGTCVESACTLPSTEGYSILLRLGGGTTALIADSSEFTLDPLDAAHTGERDLAFPRARSVEGTIRFGTDFVVESQISFRRSISVAGLVDEVRSSSPLPSTNGEDGEPIDFRASMVPSTIAYEARFAPTSSPTPGATVIPSEFVGRPLAEVFPPLFMALAERSDAVTERLDVRYGAGLFDPCNANSTTSCTVVGRVVTSNGSALEAEAGVSVVLEDARGIVVSTLAITDEQGAFRVRVGDPSRAVALRVSSSEKSPSFPTISLGPDLFDPKSGGDALVPEFEEIVFEGRVERQSALVGDALVRAVAVSIFDANRVEIPGASFEVSVRTTLSTAPDGAGLFSISLPRGIYDFVASDSATTTSLVHASVRVDPSDVSTGPVRGVTLILGPASHFDGTASGPDGRPLPFVSVQALPQRVRPSSGTPEAYARVASTNGDVFGRFDLAADRGTYDILFALPASLGLPAFVLPNVSVGQNSLGPVSVRIPAPVALFGRVVNADGSPRPGARVSAYFYRPSTERTQESVIPLAQTTADSDGEYRLLLPSTSSL